MKLTKLLLLGLALSSTGLMAQSQSANLSEGSADNGKTYTLSLSKKDQVNFV